MLNPRLIAAALPLSAAFALGCDPGSTCIERADVDVPEGTDPCDPRTYPLSGGDVGSDIATDIRTDSPTDAYPEGPYGVTRGETVGNFALDVVNGADLSFDDLRRGGSQLIMVSTAAGWCTACREEQPTLVDLHETFAEQGLTIVVAVFEDDNGSPATEAYAGGWANQYGLAFPVAIDQRNQFGAFYDTALAPMNLFIDGQTMEILAVEIGFNENTTRALVRDRLDDGGS